MRAVVRAIRGSAVAVALDVGPTRASGFAEFLSGRRHQSSRREERTRPRLARVKGRWPLSGS